MEIDNMGFLDITAQVLFDDSDTQEKLSKNQAMIDAQTADWRSKRNQILLEMHAIQQGIGLIIQSIRLTVRISGQVLSPVQNALLSMISSTTSIIIATATAMTASSLGLLAGAALALAAGAWVFSMGQSARVIAQAEETRAAFAAINARLAEMETQTRRTPQGIAF